MLRNSPGKLVLFLVFWLIVMALAPTTSAQAGDNFASSGLEPAIRFSYLTA